MQLSMRTLSTHMLTGWHSFQMNSIIRLKTAVIQISMEHLWMNQNVMRICNSLRGSETPGSFYHICHPSYLKTFWKSNTNMQIKDINKIHILEPKCTWATLHQEYEYPEDFLRSPLQDTAFCHSVIYNFKYALSYVWANDDGVRAALNIRYGTVFDWKRCNKSMDYTFDVESVLHVHQNLSSKGLQALIYNGDHDLTIPNTGTEEWIKLLGLTVVNDWRPWLVDGQIAGSTIKYSDNGYRLTYVTFKGAGHSPQEYKRREGFNMFDRFIHWRPI